MRWRQITTPEVQATNWAAMPPARPRMTASNVGRPARSESSVTSTSATRPARPRQRRMLARARGGAATRTAFGSAGTSSFFPPFFSFLAISASPRQAELRALAVGDEAHQAVLVLTRDGVDVHALLVLARLADDAARDGEGCGRVRHLHADGHVCSDRQRERIPEEQPGGRDVERGGLH